MRDTFLTPQKLSSKIGVSRPTVVRWIRNGELRAVNFSSGKSPRWKIAIADFEIFQKARETRPSKG